jgi:hypothetical protein
VAAQAHSLTVERRRRAGERTEGGGVGGDDKDSRRPLKHHRLSLTRSYSFEVAANVFSYMSGMTESRADVANNSSVKDNTEAEAEVRDGASSKSDRPRLIVTVPQQS